MAAKREREIREAATLARAEKAGLMASSISKFNSELRKDGGETPSENTRRGDFSEDYSGKKRSREERELEEAKRERDALRH